MADTDDILPEAPPASPGDAVLDQLARSENIEAYARERADQDQETETEPVQDADRAARSRRWRRRAETQRRPARGTGWIVRSRMRRLSGPSSARR